MKHNEDVNDQILVREQFTAHVRPFGPVQWSSEAHQTYNVLCLLQGALRWTDGSIANELRAPAALLVSPGEQINASGTHIDFMVGSDELEVTGIARDGERVPVLRGGVWQL